jgi:hypothetical protein
MYVLPYEENNLVLNMDSVLGLRTNKTKVKNGKEVIDSLTSS